MTPLTPKETMEQIFSREAMLQRWLDMEAALARAQASIGMVPEEVAEEIGRKAKVELLDLKKFEEIQRQVWLPTVAFIHTFQSVCDGDAGQYIHLGATSQDLVDTAQVLGLKEAYEVIYQSLRQIEDDLLNLAEQHADTIMAGRTHGIHALPITFGYKVAIWAREIRRHIQRLKECRKRIFVVQLSGAVGTMASFGSKGPQIQSLMAQDLGLGVPEIAWHASRDRLAEFANLLSIIASTLARIAHEVFYLMSTELSEAREPWRLEVVGSSTMPHKINPVISESMMSLAKKIRYHAPLVTEFMVVDHERDMYFLLGESETLRESCLAMGELLAHGENMAKNITVNPRKMRANLNILKGLMLSEAVMLELGRNIGKQSAHRVVYEDTMEAMKKDVELKEVLMKDTRVTQHLTEADLDRILQPEGYVGLAPQMARDIVALSRREREAD